MSEEKHLLKIASVLNLKISQVRSAVLLLNEGCSIPFIARYRKEATKGLNETAVTDIYDHFERFIQLDKRRETILHSLKEQGKLSYQLENLINSAEKLSELEDLYLPYKPKRRTRASAAKKKGLEPLAESLFNYTIQNAENEALNFINPDKEVINGQDALQGACDIMAEWINETSSARDKIRKLYTDTSLIYSKVIEGKEAAGSKYRNYFDWSEPLMRCPSHRMLALFRGEKEGILSLKIKPSDKNAAPNILENLFIKGKSDVNFYIKKAIEDSIKRLLGPSIETEMRSLAKEHAYENAITVFSKNLRELLLAPPLGQKIVLALDPGFRTGCKIAVMDGQGVLFAHDVIYPFSSEEKKNEAINIVIDLCKKNNVQAIAIGNGTAGRETEEFLRSISNLPEGIIITMVNEAGASVYSASKTARSEFPNLDLSFRGAVSIGRRLLDPLAELVKITPKSIGVGQYQHDVNRKALKTKLDQVVVSCVNEVGVELNTASEQLLSYVSGIGSHLAENIVKYRKKNGPFKSRTALMKMRGVGEKIFEQVSGFLRIRDGENPLDASAVHPESYPVVEKMASDLNCTVKDLLENKNLRSQIDIKKYITDTLGIPTLKDIAKELEKPGIDPRKEFELIKFTPGVNAFSDIKLGMQLSGVVTNVTDFCAFVDIGVHQDGFVHISQLSSDFVTDPKSFIKVAQKVNVLVTEVDSQRKRISLSMKIGEEKKTCSKKNTNSNVKKNLKKADFKNDSKYNMVENLAILKNKWG